MTEKNTEYKFIKFKEHVLSRSMWIGSSLISDNVYWILNEDKKFVQTRICISEALLKVFDEILVNAIDQYIRSVKFSQLEGGQVKYIHVNFNKETGEITIINDGKGFSIYYVEDINQYSVQALISREFSGGSLDDKKDKDRVTGGVNSLGIKLININSKSFIIETVDIKNNKYYKQKCSKNMDIIEEPTVIDLNSKDAKKLSKEDKLSHTIISYIPDYAKLCRHTNNDENPGWFTNENMNNFEKLIESRVYQAAVFINHTNYRYENDEKFEYKTKAKVYFNNKEIKVKNLTEYMKMFGIEQMTEFELKGDDIKFPWSICIGYANTKELAGGNMSLVNGIHVLKGGSHLNMLYNQIKTGLQSQIQTLSKENNVEFKDSMLKKTLFIINTLQIPLPQFSSQSKESITISIKDINKMKKIYIIPEKIIDNIWKMIKDVIEYKLQTIDVAKSSKKKKMTKIRKYERAEKLGIKSTLYIPEGDSAALPIRNIIMSKDSPIEKKYSGMYNIQGVPINVCKKTKEIIIDGEKKIRQDKDLQENISLQGLATVLNLNYNYTYYYGSNSERKKQGDKEFNTLNYGSIVICVDQDLDGIGNICSLIMVYFLVFWPDLYKRGFIKRLQTPLIRVYMPGKDSTVHEFYNEKDFKKWVIETYGSEDNIPENVRKNIKYYKGLGGHTPAEVKNMGDNILQNIITLTWDKDVKRIMNLYYGEDTNVRKDILLTPAIKDYTDKMLDSLKVPASEHFEIETKRFHLGFMKRKLKDACDGFIPSQRKAFAGMRMRTDKYSKIKVYQLTGYVTEKMHYQHGDTSMNETIIKMAQNFTGSNNIPVFVPISDGFGARSDGRSISSSPRYIDTKYNKIMDLIFPPEDDCLLEYIFEDGKQCEPQYYVPIIPYSILETTTTTGVGWKIGVWARDYNTVMNNLYNMIKYNYPEEKYGRKIGAPYGFMTKVWLPENMQILMGSTESSKISEICVGTYELDEIKETVRITQLPLKIWSAKLKCSLLGINYKTKKIEEDEEPPKEYIEDIIDHTANDKNDILVKLKSGSIEKITKMYENVNTCLDPIESYLGLYQILSPNLNMITKDGCVHEFKSYEEVMEYWFLIRKELYNQRLERQIILLELKIKFEQEILRFINMDDKKEINIDNKSEEERYRILSEDGHFIKFNKTNLLSPKYIKTNELKNNILSNDANYKYIDQITKGMTEKKAVQSLKKRIEDMLEELELLKSKTWKSLWLEELEKLDKMIKEGIRTKWLFEDKQYVFKNTRIEKKK